MSEFGAYQGSMAFNQTLSLQESVSINTGALTLTRALVRLPGISTRIDLNVSLRYSRGVPGILGLPPGWTIDIPYVVPAGRTLTIGGATHLIDANWSDETGYRSGLRYVNTHGVRFKQIVPPQPLPSGKPGLYAYVYIASDGSRDFFDATGKLLEHDDLYGNYQYYSYTSQLGGVYGNRLASIEDSFGQTVAFVYGSDVIRVVLPNAHEIAISISPLGVTSITDELGGVTSFQYGEKAGMAVVDQISYPTGLQTRLTYTTIPYLTQAGPGDYPAVATLTRVDGEARFLNQTNYSYGVATGGRTFTGSSAGYKLDSSSDSLMDSNNAAYQYDTEMYVVDPAGKLLAYTEYFFNYLHCVLTKTDYQVDAEGDVTPALQTRNSYVIDTSWHARTTNYDKPNQTVALAWIEQDATYRPLRQTQSTYDDYGNPLTMSIAAYDAGTGTYVPQSNSIHRYQETSWGGELPLSAQDYDGITGYSRTTSYTLTDDQKAIARAVRTWVPAGESEARSWKTTAYEYDGIGRIIAQALSWSDAGQPEPGVSTTRYAYAYNSQERLLRTTRYDGLDNPWISELQTTYPGGVLVKTIDPLGALTAHSYDALGRPTSTTNALGHTSTTVYNTWQADGTNRVVAGAPGGYFVDAICDSLGRTVQVEDNAGPQGARRVLGQTTYNPQGLVAEAVDIVGLRTIHEYDSLSRLVRTTDGLGNVTHLEIDDGQRRTDCYVNGRLRSRTALDGLGRTTQSWIYPDPQDTSIDFDVRRTWQLGGLGQTLACRVERVSRTGGNSKVLTATQWAYDGDGDVLTQRVEGFEGRPASSTTTFERDLFGNVVRSDRLVNYDDGRSFSWASEDAAFDACGQLVSRTNQIGQQERYERDAAGRVVARTRYDPSVVIRYTYNLLGQLTKLLGGDIVYTYVYDPSGRLLAASEGAQTQTYDYALDGALVRSVYPDGRYQSISRDALGRLSQVVDFAGNATTFQYTPASQLASKSCAGAVIAMQYGEANGVHGVPLGAKAIARGLSLESTYDYDGFGRRCATKTSESGSALWQTTSSFDALGRLSSITTDGAAATLTTHYVHDGLGQLVARRVQGDGSDGAEERFTYDGNANVLSRDIGGTLEEFTFNMIDQLQAPGVRFDTNGRLIAYDGRSFAYDAFDKLVHYSDAASAVQYSYYPDGNLATRERVSGAHTQFFYTDGTATQAHTKLSGQERWDTYLFTGAERVVRLDGQTGPSEAVLVANGSTAAVYTGGTLQECEYNAYGQVQDLAADRPDFGWKQAFTDADNELVYMGSRFYDPRQMRFITMDTLAVANRYAFGEGNPIDYTDPSGHFPLSQGAAIGIGMGVGFLATIATGGMLGFMFVEGGVIASAGLAGLSGAVGSIAGDATSAALSGQSFTAERALVDLAAGFAGGAAGGAVGGYVGRAVMGYALEQGLSRGAITLVGAASAGLSGGAAGGFVSTAVSCALYHEPFFTSSLALNVLAGGVAGMGGGILGSCAYMGVDVPPLRMGNPVMPVEADRFSAFPVDDTRGTLPTRVINFSATDNDNVMDAALRQGGRDAVLVHGGTRFLFPETVIGTDTYHQPMTPEEFAVVLRDKFGLGGRPVNLWACSAARLGLLSTAQRLATALGADVYAPAIRGDVTTAYRGNWIRYSP